MPEIVRTFDEATNFAFFRHQLENLDNTIHKPITNVNWGRAIKLRSGVTMSDETVSFIRSNFGSTGTTRISDIPWITQNTTAFPEISITGEKVTTPIRLAGRTITYTKFELEKAQRLEINLEAEKMEALRTLYQMAIDRMVFVGDKNLDTTDHKCRGLLNSEQVTVTDATTDFASLDNDQIVKEINDLIHVVWSQTAYSIMPDTIILPTSIYAYLATTKYSSNAEKTILTFLRENCLATVEGGKAPLFMPSRWANTAGEDGKGRIMAYVNEANRVRYSMCPIRKEQTYIDQSIRFNAPYVWALGEIEFIYPETAAYLDKVTK